MIKIDKEMIIDRFHLLVIVEGLVAFFSLLFKVDIFLFMILVLFFYVLTCVNYKVIRVSNNKIKETKPINNIKIF